MADDRIPVLTVFNGDDHVSLEKEQESIAEKIRTEHGELSYERFFASEESFEDFISRSLSPSMFPGARVFCIADSEKLTESELKFLAEAVKTHVEGVYFFILLERGKSSGKTKNKKAYTPASLIKKMGLSSNSDDVNKISRRVPREYEMPEWVVKTASSHFSRKMDKPAAEQLVDMVGTDTGRLFSELDKLDIYLDNNKKITKESVDVITDASRDVKPYEIPGMIARGEAAELIKSINLIFRGSFSAPFYVTVLFYHFWKLARLRSFAVKNMKLIRQYKKNSGNYKITIEVAYKIGVGSGLLKPSDKYGKAYPLVIKPQIIEQAQRYKEVHLKHTIFYLRDYDSNIKKGIIKADKNTFLDLCFKIMKLPDADKERHGEILLQHRV